MPRGRCPLSGVKRTSKFKSVTSACDPSRKSSATSEGGNAASRRPGKGRKEQSHGAIVKLADLSARRVLCAVRVTCAGPGSLADRSAAQSFRWEHVPLEAWPQGGARFRPQRQCSRDLQSFSGAPRSFRAWSCADFRWARGAFNSVERLSLVCEQERFWNYIRFLFLYKISGSRQ